MPDPTPDYAVIDTKAMKIARPHKTVGGRKFELRRDSEFYWACLDNRVGDNEQIYDKYIDEPDALAILRDWWCEWVRKESAKMGQKYNGPDFGGDIKYRYLDGVPIYNMSSDFGTHPDRTTALAMLVVEVAERKNT